MLRRTLFALCAAPAFMFALPKRLTARAWRYTQGKPPNGIELGVFGLESYDDPGGIATKSVGYSDGSFDVLGHFNGDTFEVNDALLHRLLDVQIAELRRKIADRPELDIWRVGQIRLGMRVRSGAVRNADDERWFQSCTVNERIKGAV